jgi:hypothetical protein
MNNPGISTAALSRAARLLALLSLFALAGCDLAGAVVAESTGDATVKAKYTPDKNASMLVLVESYGLAVDSDIESQHIALTLGRALADEKVANILDQQTLETLRDADPDGYSKLTIADIGRKVGAKQVLYVDIQRDEIEKPPGSGQMRGQIEAVIKIVDSSTGDTRWPKNESSEAVRFTSDWTPESNSSTDTDLRAKMADRMADDISKLFHDYKVDTIDQDLNSPGNAVNVN